MLTHGIHEVELPPLPVSLRRLRLDCTATRLAPGAAERLAAGLARCSELAALDLGLACPGCLHVMGKTLLSLLQ